ncbi:hypothetical protein IVB30_08270 [Bradyrhizobium sp. 200]|uniref:hypothetical protein n=1 Tax=Bradyrhizobium sp. 200 TaxID=2782665 RepID=UPI001FFFCAE4|nr:hypothetical protein [Bradyrhizobium sp. 200]UPJ51328.1 hypothetical protein IVB30_08270 [Bradyrhizobium sp. 200]
MTRASIEKALFKVMDCRVKPGNDGGGVIPTFISNLFFTPCDQELGRAGLLFGGMLLPGLPGAQT